jgi:hypothetical protein
MADQHTLRSRMYSPDIKYGNGIGPTRHPINALALRAGRPKKKAPALPGSTVQAVMRGRPVVISVKQSQRGK